MLIFRDIKEYEDVVKEMLEADLLLNLFDIPLRLQDAVKSLRDEIVKRIENRKGYVVPDGIRKIFFLIFMKEIVKKAINMNISFEQMADLINDTYNRRIIITLLDKVIENISSSQDAIISSPMSYDSKHSKHS